MKNLKVFHFSKATPLNLCVVFELSREKYLGVISKILPQRHLNRSHCWRPLLALHTQEAHLEKPAHEGRGAFAELSLDPRGTSQHNAGILEVRLSEFTVGRL